MNRKNETLLLKNIYSDTLINELSTLNDINVDHSIVSFVAIVFKIIYREPFHIYPKSTTTRPNIIMKTSYLSTAIVYDHTYSAFKVTFWEANSISKIFLLNGLEPGDIVLFYKFRIRMIKGIPHAQYDKKVHSSIRLLFRNDQFFSGTSILLKDIEHLLKSNIFSMIQSTKTKDYNINNSNYVAPIKRLSECLNENIYLSVIANISKISLMGITEKRFIEITRFKEKFNNIQKYLILSDSSMKSVLLLLKGKYNSDTFVNNLKYEINNKYKITNLEVLKDTYLYTEKSSYCFSTSKISEFILLDKKENSKHDLKIDIFHNKTNDLDHGMSSINEQHINQTYKKIISLDSIEEFYKEKEKYYFENNSVQIKQVQIHDIFRDTCKRNDEVISVIVQCSNCNKSSVFNKINIHDKDKFFSIHDLTCKSNNLNYTFRYESIKLIIHDQDYIKLEVIATDNVITYLLANISARMWLHDKIYVSDNIRNDKSLSLSNFLSDKNIQIKQNSIRLFDSLFDHEKINYFNVELSIKKNKTTISQTNESIDHNLGNDSIMYFDNRTSRSVIEEDQFIIENLEIIL